MTTPNDQGKVTKRVAKSIDELNAGEPNDLVELSSGVVLKVRQANPNMLIRIMTKDRRPEPPLVFIEALGKSIENTDDPDYSSRVKAWDMDNNASMLYAFIGLGTTLHSKPKGMPGPDENEWLDEYKIYGLEVYPESKTWRYITWVLFKAALIDKDTEAINEKVRQLSGVKEADVRDATTFPEGDEAGR